MTRTLNIFVFAASACTTQSTTTPSDDPLAGESNDGDSSKADSAHDNFTYVAVEKDGAFNCNGNPLLCTPYKLTRVNRAQITCNDDQLHDNCMVKAVSFSGFSQDAQTKLNNALEAEAMDPSIGIQVVVKGQFKIYVDFLAYEVSEAWLAQLPAGSTDNTWVRLSDTGLRCLGAGCAPVLEEKLNSNRTARISSIDFGDSPDQKIEQDTWTQERKPDGVIVVGSRTNGVGQPGNYKTSLRSVDQVFLPVN